VEPGYGDDVYEADYLLLFIVADLRMDPALRPRPVSSVAFAYLGNTYNSTTRLNDGIFTVRRFSVATSARLHKSECVFRFYVYGRIFDNPPGLLSARGTDCFCFVVFSFFLLFECKQWGPHPSPPEGAQLTVRGGGFLLSRVLLLVICLLFMFL
jgi:hypothetical protein